MKKIIKNKDFKESTEGWDLGEDFKKSSKYPPAKEFKGMVSLYLQKLGKTYKGEPGTIFGFPSEEDDPINGMHEFRYQLHMSKNPKCLHCGKTQKQLDKKLPGKGPWFA